MEKKVTTYKHLKIIQILLAIFSVGYLYIFYSNFFGDYFVIIQTLQDSAIVLLAFILIFSIFNIHLVAGDVKSRKVFDHLYLAAFMYYLVIFSVTYLDKLSDGSVYILASELEIAHTQIFINYLLLVILIPIILMITLVWSVRNIRVLSKTEKRTKDSSLKMAYYIFVLLSLVGVTYSIFTPLYILY